jgi:hypothetical protein
MKFTAEPESNNQIKFLDITIHKKTAKWTFSIYRKPSFTDSIIPYSSNHPPQHKHAAIRYLHNRLNTYNMKNTKKNWAPSTASLRTMDSRHTHTDPPP